MNKKQGFSALLVTAFLATVVPVSAAGFGWEGKPAGGFPLMRAHARCNSTVFNASVIRDRMLERHMNATQEMLDSLSELGVDTGEIEALLLQIREKVQAMDGPPMDGELMDLMAQLRQEMSEIREQLGEDFPFGKEGCPKPGDGPGMPGGKGLHNFGRRGIRPFGGRRGPR